MRDMTCTVHRSRSLLALGLATYIAFKAHCRTATFDQGRAPCSMFESPVKRNSRLAKHSNQSTADRSSKQCAAVKSRLASCSSALQSQEQGSRWKREDAPMGAVRIMPNGCCFSARRNPPTPQPASDVSFQSSVRGRNRCHMLSCVQYRLLQGPGPATSSRWIDAGLACPGQTTTVPAEPADKKA